MLHISCKLISPQIQAVISSHTCIVIHFFVRYNTCTRGKEDQSAPGVNYNLSQTTTVVHLISINV
jgi:hypothetical protein